MDFQWIGMLTIPTSFLKSEAKQAGNFQFGRLVTARQGREGGQELCTKAKSLQKQDKWMLVAGDGEKRKKGHKSYATKRNLGKGRATTCMNLHELSTTCLCYMSF